jgi:hypothetical protein
VLKLNYIKFKATNIFNKNLRNSYAIMHKQVAAFIQNVSSTFNWARCVKTSNGLISPLLNIGSLIHGSRSKTMVLGVLHLSRFSLTFVKKAGMKGFSLYLKAASQYLFAVQSGNPLRDPTLFGTRVKLTGGGIPVFVPVFWRRKMNVPS